MRSDRGRGIVSFAASWTARSRPAGRDGPDARSAVPVGPGVSARRWLLVAVWLVVLAAGAGVKIGGGRRHIGNDSGNAVSASGKLLRLCGASTRASPRADEHGEGGSMYYSKGNYEAFARPRKPAGVDEKSAYFVGGGLASLAGAAFLIRDGQ